MEEFLNVYEFAKKLRVHPQTIRRCIKSGRIQAFRISDGKRAGWRIPTTELGRLAIFDVTKTFERIIEEKLQEKIDGERDRVL
jgi:excisionase family DNA binding protein